MRTITAALIVSSLLVSNSFAATKAVAPLPAGKPAGASQAAMLGPNFALIMLGLGVVIGGVVLAASKPSDGVTGPISTSTATTALP